MSSSRRRTISALTSATVFWDTSGFSVSLGAQGLSLNVASLSQLVQGGVAFSTMAAGGAPVESGHLFRLQPDEETARASLFGSAEDDIRLSILVDNDLSGLTTDSDVVYEGLTVGRVTDLGVDIDESRPDGEEVRQRITFVIAPQPAWAGAGRNSGRGVELPAGSCRQGVARPCQFLRVPGDFKGGGTGRTAACAARQDRHGYETLSDDSVDPARGLRSQRFGRGLFTRLGSLNLEGLLQSATNMMDAVTQVAASPGYAGDPVLAARDAGRNPGCGRRSEGDDAGIARCECRRQSGPRAG